MQTIKVHTKIGSTQTKKFECECETKPEKKEASKTPEIEAYWVEDIAYQGRECKDTCQYVAENGQIKAGDIILTKQGCRIDTLIEHYWGSSLRIGVLDGYDVKDVDLELDDRKCTHCAIVHNFVLGFQVRKYSIINGVVVKRKKKFVI